MIMMRVVSWFARCADWLRRELDRELERGSDDAFWLILPPVS